MGWVVIAFFFQQGFELNGIRGSLVIGSSFFGGGLLEVEVYNAEKTMTLSSMQWQPPMLQQVIDYLR
jgi:hypothetical protein